MTAIEAALRRRSHSRVTPVAPTREQLLPLVAAAGTVADYGSLRPWRLLELRGEARERLGAAFAEARSAQHPESTERDLAKLAGKPLRAELLIAVVVSIRPSVKADVWEQEASAAGVAHLLSLLLDDAGWGVMWRSGPLTRTDPVRRVHELADSEYLLGWLYVGGVVEGSREGPKRRVDPELMISAL